MANNTVLVIDDDIWMQRILSKTLKSFGFDEVYLASNGYDGLSIAIDSNPNLIILDLVMPELTGHNVLKLLKNISLTKDIPVIIISSLSDTENLGLAVKFGVKGFVSKPFTRATVYDKLLDTFGSEKLDMIMNRIPIEKKEESDYGINISFDDDDFEKLTNQLKGESISADTTKEKSENIQSASGLQKDSKKSNVSPNQLLQYYNEDERQSIESIRKMLIKDK